MNENRKFKPSTVLTHILLIVLVVINLFPLYWMTTFSLKDNDEIFGGYQFINRHDQLGNEMNELSHKQSQMLLDGIDEDIINRTLSAEAARLAKQEDSLVTNFIVENFDNVLGPGVFMMMTSGYPYPVLTPQIEDIMSKATKKFKEDPYVKQYYQTANEIQARQNGLVDDTPQTQPAPAPQEQMADSMSLPSLNLPQE